MQMSDIDSAGMKQETSIITAPPARGRAAFCFQP